MTLKKKHFKMCEIQANLFYLSAIEGYDSVEFIEKFMHSKTCAEIDNANDFDEYKDEHQVLKMFLSEVSLNKGCSIFDSNIMRWIGHIYRFWNFYTGETSEAVYKISGANTMRLYYIPCHLMSPPAVIDKLKEAHLYRQKKNN